MDTSTVNLHRKDLTSMPGAVARPRTLLVLLMVILMLAVGTLSGYGVARLHFLFPLTLIVAPFLIFLLVHHPFEAVVMWLIVAPFFVRTDSATTRYVFWLTHRTLIPLALLITLVNGAIKKRLRFDSIDLFTLAYLLIAVFSVLYYYPDSPIPEFYRAYDLILVSVALFWLVRFTQPREAKLRHMTIALVLMSLTQGIVGLMMNFPDTRAMLPQVWLEISNDRTTGTLGRVAEYSSTLTASILLVAHYAVHVRKLWLKILCFITLLVSSTCLVLSFSRGTWLATTIVGLLAVVLYPRLRSYVIIMAAIILLVLSTQAFADHILYASERLENQKNIDARIVSDYAQLRMIQVKPLLGWGWNNYDHYQSAFLRPVGGIAVPDSFIASHNTYLSMAVELGMVGLAAFLLPGLLLLKRSMAVFRKLPEAGFYSRYLLIVLWLGVIFWFVVTNFMNMRVAPWGMTWIGLLLGLIASMVDAAKEPPGQLESSR